MERGKRRSWRSEVEGGLVPKSTQILGHPFYKTQIFLETRGFFLATPMVLPLASRWVLPRSSAGSSTLFLLPAEALLSNLGMLTSRKFFLMCNLNKSGNNSNSFSVVLSNHSGQLPSQSLTYYNDHFQSAKQYAKSFKGKSSERLRNLSRVKQLNVVGKFRLRPVLLQAGLFIRFYSSLLARLKHTESQHFSLQMVTNNLIHLYVNDQLVYHCMQTPTEANRMDRKTPYSSKYSLKYLTSLDLRRFSFLHTELKFLIQFGIQTSIQLCDWCVNRVLQWAEMKTRDLQSKRVGGCGQTRRGTVSEWAETYVKNLKNKLQLF